MKNRIVLIAFLLGGFNTLAQEIDQSRELKQIILDRIEFIQALNDDLEQDHTELFEHFEYYLRHPLSLNTASANDIAQLGILNEIQANEIIAHRLKYGKFLTLEELQQIESISLQDIRMIQPFVKAGHDGIFPSPSLQTIMHEGKSMLLHRTSRILEQQEGYRSSRPIESRYMGNAFKLYNRFQFSYYNRLSLGVSMEKDAGERFRFDRHQKGFDFYSVHCYLKDIGRIHQLAIGDYVLQYGQGLTLWTGMAYGGVGIASLKRNPRGILPYRSVNENQFLRGVATSYRLGQVNLDVFYSNKQIDSRLIQEVGERKSKISSLPQSGFHRTPSEINNRRNTKELLMGQHMTLHFKRARIGITSVYQELSHGFHPTASDFKRYDLPRAYQFNVGWDHQFYWKNFLFYGEFADKDFKSISFLQGVLWSIGNQLSLGYLFRSYSKKHRSTHNNPISNSSSNSNEIAHSISADLKIGKAINILAFLDLHRTPWIKTSLKGLESSVEHSVQLNYSSSKRSQLYFRYRGRQRTKRTTEPQVLRMLSEELYRSLRIQFNQSVTEFIRIQNRIEFNSYKFEDQHSRGFLIYQDLIYQNKNAPLSLSLRYGLFDTDEFENRIYAYERDLLYVFSVPAYQGKGVRFVFLLKWSIKKGIDFWLRFDQSSYFERLTVGSGLEKIENTKRSQIKSQLRLQF